jgi:DNA-binding HxlR family transcriptional regulator
MKVECEQEFYEYKGTKYPCTLSLAMSLVGGKWKTVILYHLRESKKRYSELRNCMPTVSERTLSLQLKQLEGEGLVNRKVNGKKPPIKVTYQLTEFGHSFVPILEAITEWGNQIVLNKIK